MRWFKSEKTGKFVNDELTGRVYELEKESVFDIVAAFFSLTYLIVFLCCLAWLTVDISIGNKTSFDWIGIKKVEETKDKSTNGNQIDTQENEKSKNLNENQETNQSTKQNDNQSENQQSTSENNKSTGDTSQFPLLLLTLYTLIGGALGAIAKGIKSCILWHADLKGFGWRYTWKYITQPFLGASLAAIVFAITRSGVAVFGGEVSIPKDASDTQTLATFAIGALAGFGTNDVAEWIRDKVKRLFRIAPSKVPAPDLIGKTEDEAKEIFKKINLQLGSVSREESDNEQDGKIIKQTPKPGSLLSETSTVDIVIGKKKTDSDK